MGNYIETAKNIVKESIKSAVYIDENAREPFEKGTAATESDLSKNLYEIFKKQQVSLSIYKYTKNDYEQQKDFLFSKKDFVLLDWKLNKEEGEDEALKILDDIIYSYPSVHFCAVYTKESGNDLDKVFDNIISYFSGYDIDELSDLKQHLETEFPNGEIENLLGNIIHPISRYRFDIKARELLDLLRTNYQDIYSNILRCAKEKETIDSIIKTSIAYSKTFKSNEKKSKLSYLSFSKKTIVVNNTIILLLNKKDVIPAKLINRYAKTICEDDFSFLKLLGVEMQNILSKKASFISDSLLPGTRDIFIHHKNQSQDSCVYNDFIKSIMLDYIRLCVEQEQLRIVDALPKKAAHGLTEDDYIKVNSYYDSLAIPNKTKLSFGDVFIYNNTYFLCVTALCDCLHPNKDCCFYFVKGNKINKKLAVKLGEGGFISYIKGDTAINWATLSPRPTKQDQYKPTYIKPQPIIVRDTAINNGKLRVTLTNDLKEVDFEYLTTIKYNYTQRIANHAFAHPVRVGIDFLKK